MSPPYTLTDFDYALPAELIAQHPSAERSGSRLLDGRGEPPVDRRFVDLPELLNPGDLLVFNDTRVVKARLYGEKATGGKLELLIERVLDGHEVAAHLRVSKKPAPGARLRLAAGVTAEVLGRWPAPGGPLYHLRLSHEPHALTAPPGHVPRPPYTTGEGAEDERRSQTVLARTPGGVAAPTAALHFDEPLLARLAARGVHTASVTLHVGAGTFQPVKAERIADHVMHAERYAVPEATQAAIAQCHARGARVVAVGTTVVRTLESWAASGEASGDTRIFITPGFGFRVVDLLVTNFHLPRSTLLMLISAFAGHEHWRRLYAHAVRGRYRFFSYGDAMLLERKPP